MDLTALLLILVLHLAFMQETGLLSLHSPAYNLGVFINCNHTLSLTVAKVLFFNNHNLSPTTL